MPNIHYDSSRTALLLVDPYNDFLAEGGKLWALVQPVAEAVGLLDNLRSTVASARNKGVTVFFVPHRRWREGDYEGWDHPNPSQIGTNQHQVFAKGSWGGEWHPDFVPQKGDVVAGEHWAQSGFANTDLDAQLKQRGITHVIVVGLLANTCIESTARFAMEMGYHVTLVRDATAAFSHEHMHAAHDLNGPTFAHAITTTSELVATLAHPGAAVAI
ncbi:isochorismatase family cysteine hydrolase [Bradyrhizobium sp.]|jgi:nicotinamidase-related amidase|uniref:isochorismatase family cysteine hydrolase n=1 Tax=Bradyrhizobium sp. TaxID=376 RepID=UPI001D370712|nr:isochorismatase family cysteine hydrolase [Bradyrhizobium sp.]MBI5317927.1 cysteine hydrolase [Bradyrhizobium sp.]